MTANRDGCGVLYNVEYHKNIKKTSFNRSDYHFRRRQVLHWWPLAHGIHVI